MDTQHLIAFALFVALTVGRQVQYAAHQAQHRRLNLPQPPRRADQIGSALLAILYSVIWLGTIYALYINEFAVGWYVAGLSLLIVGVIVRLKALRDLGRNYSHEAVIHANHQLVTNGIYGWIRHPLNLTLVIELLGMVLVARELWILIAWACLTLVEIRRTRLEDKMLLEAFGDKAKHYQQTVPSVNVFVHLFRGLRCQ